MSFFSPTTYENLDEFVAGWCDNATSPRRNYAGGTPAEKPSPLTPLAKKSYRIRPLSPSDFPAAKLEKSQENGGGFAAALKKVFASKTLLQSNGSFGVNLPKTMAEDKLDDCRYNRLSSTSTSEESGVAEAQRLSFTSISTSTTGYSSARSSIRSSTEPPSDSPTNSAEDCDENWLRKPLLCEQQSSSAQKRLSILSDANLDYLGRISVELLDTERNYVNDLHAIVQGYLNGLLKERDNLGITAIEVCQLFGNVEQVFDLSRRFYHQLDQCQLDLVKMAGLFVNNDVAFAAAYTDYCLQYPSMAETLTGLEKCESVKAWLENRRIALGHSLPLGTHLLKPVQRLLKYHLFLENLLKHASEVEGLDSGTVEALSKALDCARARAREVNEVKKRQEHGKRVLEIQATLQSWTRDHCQDLSQYGDLVLEGQFRLNNSKTTRQLFLFDEILLITKEKADKTLICKDYIMCSSMMLVENYGQDELAFQVFSAESPKSLHTFVAVTKEMKRRWTSELKRLMMEHFENESHQKTEQLFAASKIINSAVQQRCKTHKKNSTPSSVGVDWPRQFQQQMRRRSIDNGLSFDGRRNGGTTSFFAEIRALTRSKSKEPRKHHSKSASTTDLHLSLAKHTPLYTKKSARRRRGNSIDEHSDEEQQMNSVQLFLDGRRKSGLEHRRPPPSHSPRNRHSIEHRSSQKRSTCIGSEKYQNMLHVDVTNPFDADFYPFDCGKTETALNSEECATPKASSSNNAIDGQQKSLALNEIEKTFDDLYEELEQFRLEHEKTEGQPVKQSANYKADAKMAVERLTELISDHNAEKYSACGSLNECATSSPHFNTVTPINESENGKANKPRRHGKKKLSRHHSEGEIGNSTLSSAEFELNFDETASLLSNQYDSFMLFPAVNIKRSVQNWEMRCSIGHEEVDTESNTLSQSALNLSPIGPHNLGVVHHMVQMLEDNVFGDDKGRPMHF